jgi:hypothetical protein
MRTEGEVLKYTLAIESSHYAMYDIRELNVTTNLQDEQEIAATMPTQQVPTNLLELANTRIHTINDSNRAKDAANKPTQHVATSPSYANKQ